VFSPKTGRNPRVVHEVGSIFLFKLARKSLWFWCKNLKGINRPLRSPRCSWEDNIRLDLREIGEEGMDQIHLAMV
jgi:hypothetical protein